MADGISDGARFDRDELDPSVKVYVLAILLAAATVCIGGALAIAAAVNGASNAVSLTVLTASVFGAALAAVAIVHRGRRRVPASGGRSRRELRRDRRALRRDRRAIRRAEICSPAVMLEEQLAARYGVPVERVAPHVWRIDGELVEATLDPVSGQLMTGGRELQL